ncbi:MAG TPA: saccharopine dehydrogenase C-terminal domain-containing protein [Longimicrobiales bacterium]|nr:saccharopine dehydrogenase C-terminal domain-containing protein [Longimicrobiales bacterium]
MQFLVLGAGLQGSACAYDLLGQPDVERVVLADRVTAALPPYLQPYAEDPRLVRIELDARDDASVREAMGGVDACLNALPYLFNLRMARLAVGAGVHYADLGGNTAMVFEQLELDEAARASGICVIPDCGLAPGLVNVLAAAAIREMDSTERVRIYVGGLPEEPRPPLDYHIVYSIEGMLDYYTTPSWVLRGGRLRQVDALTGVEPVTFPLPIGVLEAFHTGGGLSVLPWTYEGRIPTMEYKTLRYPGHAAIVRAIRDLGLFDIEPVRVGGQEIIPRQVFIACAEPHLKARPDERDFVAARVEVEGRRDDERASIIFELIDHFDTDTGISAMARTTGFSLSITGMFMVSGRIDTVGAMTPDRCVPADDYVAELGKRGVVVRRVTA